MPLDRGPSRPWITDGGHEIEPPRHPPHAYIGPDGWRNIDMEIRVRPRKDGAIVVHEDEGPVAVVVELNAEGIEWFLSALTKHKHDRFYRSLEYARGLAKEIAWDRAVGQ